MPRKNVREEEDELAKKPVESKKAKPDTGSENDGAVPSEDAGPKPRRSRSKRSEPEPIHFSLMDVLRSGVSPSFYMEFMDCAEQLARLRKVVKFTDEDLLQAVTYYELNGRQG